MERPSRRPRRRRNVALQAESRARPRRRDLRATTTDHEHASAERSRPRRDADSIAIPRRVPRGFDYARLRRRTRVRASSTKAWSDRARHRRRTSCAHVLENATRPPRAPAPVGAAASMGKEDRRGRWGGRRDGGRGRGSERPRASTDARAAGAFRGFYRHIAAGRFRTARAGKPSPAPADSRGSQAAGLDPISDRFSALACGLVSSSSGSSASSNTSRMSSTSTISS